jgi:hypothetical protein
MEVVGNVKADYITLIRTPRLKKMDQPYPEDLAAFEQNIAQALKIQMAGAIKHPQIDLSLIADELAAFTWKRVFDRVQNVYYNVLYHCNPFSENSGDPRQTMKPAISLH